MMKINNVLTLCLLFLISSCSNNKYNSEQYIGDWFGVISLPGGELPFHFSIKSNKENLTATLINGKEKISIKEVAFENDSLTLFLPAFNTKLRLIKDKKNDRLKGTLALVKSGGILQVMPVIAKKTRNKIDNLPEINISGRWDVKFIDEDKNLTISVGEFEQDGNKVTGTFLTTTGDYRYLSGYVQKDKLLLSTFDGAHVFLFKANIVEENKLVGDFWSGTKWHETWTAQKNKNAKLPNEDSLTFLKKGYDKFDFTFEDLDGKKVSLSDSKYTGKVVLINLAGSWCPNCHDEARFLSEYYKRNEAKGLKIIALMFENYPEKNKSIKQIVRFKEKFNIEYDLLYAGINNKNTAAEKLPMLNKVLAFPTTIYIDKKGKVRKITTGFSGPGTGKHFIKFQEKFDRFVSYLLDEK